MAKDRAEKELWSYRDFLALLLAEEVARRLRKSRKLLKLCGAVGGMTSAMGRTESSVGLLGK
ncbi:MAG: hypothetical protein WAK48_14730 [Candidatus Acidiferrum sp.]